MTRSATTDLDLTITRVIAAPRERVWAAWADPDQLAQWWIPAPMLCKVVDFDLTPGGAFTTHMSEGGGDSAPHIDGCFLAVDDGQRIVFTNTLVGGWRPAESGFMTAVITFADHPDGTEYVSTALHKSVADAAMHETMGFYEGWGAVAAQLANLVED